MREFWNRNAPPTLVFHIVSQPAIRRQRSNVHSGQVGKLGVGKSRSTIVFTCLHFSTQNFPTFLPLYLLVPGQFVGLQAESRWCIELLRLRFEENIPIRENAKRWGIDAARLHHAYALARQEFRATLMELVAFHHPDSPAEVEIEAAGLLRALS